jgi:hypothetical protein
MEFDRNWIAFLNVISLINDADIWIFDVQTSSPMLLEHYAMSDATAASGY